MVLIQLRLETVLLEAVMKIYDEEFPGLCIKTATDAVRHALRDFIKGNGKSAPQGEQNE